MIDIHVKHLMEVNQLSKLHHSFYIKQTTLQLILRFASNNIAYNKEIDQMELEKNHAPLEFSSLIQQMYDGR